MKVLLCSFLLLLSCSSVTAQSLQESSARDFINSLLVRRDRLDKFILPGELELSKRLDISYRGIDKKYLISNDFDSASRAEIVKNRFTFTYSITRLSDHYSVLKAIIPKLDITKEYYFKDSLLISKPLYYSADWDTVSSEYFIFHVSDISQFNHYAADRLDNFVNNISHLLDYTDSEVKQLHRNKIHYFLCKDEKEIELLTGYQARGLYYIPYDYIISTFSCHYHELLHLLINYKLKDLYLYTLPFFQEGFAVAFGGRGGRDSGVILDMGRFLVQSGMLNYSMLLSRPEFYQSDISMSYPVSGLYNKFLIETAGIKKYLALYQKYSTTEDKIDYLTIDKSDLPADDKWQEYIKPDDHPPIIVTPGSMDNYKVIDEKENSYKVSVNDGYYFFQIKDTLLLIPPIPVTGYQSKLFNEIFPGRIYQSEKYALIADSNEISVYNFYSNNLEAKYVKGFSADQKDVGRVNGSWNFLLSTKLFDEAIAKLQIR
ncbi:MAG TPA: hypothetical protein VKD08_01425 [Ignavibacteriaceae bacterium]|nr:hypothetical protein [Ignavibacteriaceae bacterium]